MRTRPEIKLVIRETLESQLDHDLLAAGFRRGARSVFYKRETDSCSQKIEFDFDLRPHYRPEADAHLLPKFRLGFVELHQIGVDLLGGDEWLLAGADCVARNPIEWAAPEHSPWYWYIYRNEDAAEAIGEIKKVIVQWVLPLLNEYSTDEALVRGYDAGDRRVLSARHQYMYVVAALIKHGSPKKAMEVLESVYGQAGARRQYAAAFEAVQRLI